MALKRPLQITGGVLATAVLLAGGVGYAAATTMTDQFKHVDAFSGLKNRPVEKGGENILLVGNDGRDGMTKAERSRLHVGQGEYGSNAEPIMIVHLADNGSVNVVSLPRDSDVVVPEYTTASGKTVAEHNAKLNSGYGEGGPKLMVDIVEQNTGVHIDHYMQVDFLGFESMVNSLDGISICTPVALNDTEAGLKLPAGTSELNGAQALAYVRARHVDATSDYGRMKRQQEFLAAVFDKVTSPEVLLNPIKLYSFLDATGSAITVDNDFSQGDMLGLAAKLRGVSPSSITFQTIPTSGTNWAGNETWDMDKAEPIFATLNSGASLQKPKTPKAEKADGADSSSSASTSSAEPEDAQRTAADPIC